MDLDARLAHAARVQHGAVSREQLADLGCTTKQLHTRVRGRLLLPLTRAFVLAAAPPSFEQRCMAAVLGAGHGAVLSHRTAAYLYGFDRFREPSDVEVTIPAGRRLQVRRGVHLHHADVPTGDRVRHRRLPVTSPVRTILDLARSHGREDLEAAIDCAIRDGRTDMATLRRRLARERGKGKRGVRLLDRVLTGRPAGGVHSELEREFLRILDRYGLPRPTTQVVHRDGRGRPLRVDCLYEERNLVVELNGHRDHSTRQATRRDARRGRRLTGMGREHVAFTYDEVFYEREVVAADMAVLLGVTLGDPFT